MATSPLPDPEDANPEGQALGPKPRARVRHPRRPRFYPLHGLLGLAAGLPVTVGAILASPMLWEWAQLWLVRGSAKAMFSLVWAAGCVLALAAYWRLVYCTAWRQVHLWDRFFLWGLGCGVLALWHLYPWVGDVWLQAALLAPWWVVINFADIHHEAEMRRTQARIRWRKKHWVWLDPDESDEEEDGARIQPHWDESIWPFPIRRYKRARRSSALRKVWSCLAKQKRTTR